MQHIKYHQRNLRPNKVFGIGDGSQGSTHMVVQHDPGGG